jgi:hypothetical protein
VYRTPAGRIVGADHAGPKRKVADSQREYRRLVELQSLERAGVIRQLRTQRPIRLVVNGVKIGVYRCDFSYLRNGRLVIEDVKGVRTAVYKLKKLLVKALHGIDILET